MPVSKKRKTKKNGAPNRRLTIRQSARKTAEETMSQIIEAYDIVKAIKPNVIDLIAAELAIAREYVENKLNETVVALDVEEQLGQALDQLEAFQDKIDADTKTINNALVAIDGIMKEADVSASQIMELVKNKKDIGEVRDDLLGLEIDLTNIVDSALMHVNNANTIAMSIGLEWKELISKVPGLNEQG